MTSSRTLSHPKPSPSFPTTTQIKLHPPWNMTSLPVINSKRNANINSRGTSATTSHPHCAHSKDIFTSRVETFPGRQIVLVAPPFRHFVAPPTIKIAWQHDDNENAGHEKEKPNKKKSINTVRTIGKPNKNLGVSRDRYFHKESRLISLVPGIEVDDWWLNSGDPDTRSQPAACLRLV